jgi:hypothetical protein
MAIPELRMATPEEIAEWEAEPPQPQRRVPVQCSCGRFAKFLGIERRYNGNYTCERMNVLCKAHGIIGIELV